MFRLLLIDDSPDDRILIIDELRREFPDIQVEEVIEAKGFKQALDTGNFDVAITDCHLYWNDGLTMLRKIKSRYPNCPVIMFSDRGSEEIAVEAIKMGLDDYITKSAKHYTRLLFAVDSALKRTQHSMRLKQAEVALQQSEERFRLVVESVKDYAIFTTDPDGYITSWNKAAENILGYQEAEIIGHSSSCIFTPEDREQGEDKKELQTAKTCGRAEDDRWHLRSDGKRFWASGIVTPLRDQAGDLLGFSKIMRDMTEQKQAEEEIQRLNKDLERRVQERTAQLQKALEFEAMLKRITDKVRDSLDESYILQTAVQELAQGLEINGCDVAIYDLEAKTSTITCEYICSEIPAAVGHVTHIIEQSEIYAQLLQGKYVHFCWITLFPGSIRALAKRFSILACPIIDGQCVLGDMWLFQPKENYFKEQEIRLVQQVASQCAIALRQARLYQEAQAQVEALEKLNSLKDDFLNTVSHELRSPLSSIKMGLSMLEINLKQVGVINDKPNQTTQYLRILRDECQREISLINDLLDLSRLDAGHQALNLTTLNLTAWIPHVAESFTGRVCNQQQSLEMNISTNLPVLTTDVSELERILKELLHNACKYTPAKGQILVAATAVSDKLRLQVSNSGVEIPASELSRIFDKFYRIPNNDPWKHGGTGLGLALVKKLVEHLGGTIQATASQQWTTFTVELPFSPFE